MKKTAFALHLIALTARLAVAGPVLQADSKTVLPVRLYNYSAASRETVLAAWAETRHVLQKAGISVRVRYLHLVKGIPVADSGTTEAFEGSRGLQVKLVSTEMASKLGLSKLGLGLAVVSSEGPNELAYIDFERARKWGRTEGFSLRSLIGHLIAHEIGHLLLGSGSHRDNGLMKANFYRPELIQAGQRQLLFSEDQAAQIRKSVQARFGG